jgi:excisionase family DNA binding protein
MDTYADGVLTPAMVAEMFHVSPTTVTRWANQGKLPAFRTPGGHRRFRAKAVQKVLAEAGAG